MKSANQFEVVLEIRLQGKKTPKKAYMSFVFIAKRTPYVTLLGLFPYAFIVHGQIHFFVDPIRFSNITKHKNLFIKDFEQFFFSYVCPSFS